MKVYRLVPYVEVYPPLELAGHQAARAQLTVTEAVVVENDAAAEYVL